MKRFYKQVAAAPVDGGFGVELDGKALRTPAKAPLLLPTAPLAAAVADEWAAQDETVKPDTMRLMQLASTAIDRVARHRLAVVDEAAGYAASDLLCYRAEAPDSLIAREAALWQPLLDWAMVRFDAPLAVTRGIVHVDQPEASLKALKAILLDLDVLTLTAVADLTAATGSLVIALAVWDGHLDAAGAAEATLIDETVQNERWGEDAEAKARRDRLVADIHAAARFLQLLKA
ncbi:ATPase [Aliidongia dinghuensis]|uniref:ATPase n=1 Tax=Aliidongia dinghuensis TaxID=1867774 RepID=A0A8J3E544_9PROT|nr:ATP12 family protein [Aliidongia dinghuensis]GGF29495.1 ATPase [Aliidongia dinghuensis]